MSRVLLSAAGLDSLTRGRSSGLPVLGMQSPGTAVALALFQVQHARVVLAIAEGRRVQAVASHMRCEALGSDRFLQPIMPLDLPVKVRPWELTVYPRSYIRR